MRSRVPTSSKATAAPASAALPYGCSSQKVRVLSRRISQHFDHFVTSSGLKTTQYSLLSTIVRLGPVRPGDLARAMSLDASTLTRNLQPLMTAGWVTVGPGDDERSRLVEATASGRDKRVEAQRAWKRAQLAFNGRIGEAAVSRLHAAVDDCMALLDAVEESPDPAD
jgi:DNA-binding MarR family transcriptional regulator